MNTPEPLDESNRKEEIRGGDRPSDYIPGSGGSGDIGWTESGEETGDDDTDWYARGGFPPGTFQNSEAKHLKGDGAG